MSQYTNVTVYDLSSDDQVASGATANIINDAENAQLYGGTWSAKPFTGDRLRLTSGGLLDWTGVLTGGQGTKTNPYNLTVTDSERERRLARAKASAA